MSATDVEKAVRERYRGGDRERIIELATAFDRSRDTLRQPRETEGEDYRATSGEELGCVPGDCC